MPFLHSVSIFQRVCGLQDYGQVRLQGGAGAGEVGAGDEHRPVCGEDQQEGGQDHPRERPPEK